MAVSVSERYRLIKQKQDKREKKADREDHRLERLHGQQFRLVGRLRHGCSVGYGKMSGLSKQTRSSHSSHLSNDGHILQFNRRLFTRAFLGVRRHVRQVSQSAALLTLPDPTGVNVAGHDQAADDQDDHPGDDAERAIDNFQNDDGCSCSLAGGPVVSFEARAAVRLHVVDAHAAIGASHADTIVDGLLAVPTDVVRRAEALLDRLVVSIVDLNERAAVQTLTVPTRDNFTVLATGVRRTVASVADVAGVRRCVRRAVVVRLQGDARAVVLTGICLFADVEEQRQWLIAAARFFQEMYAGEDRSDVDGRAIAVANGAYARTRRVTGDRERGATCTNRSWKG